MLTNGERMNADQTHWSRNISSSHLYYNYYIELNRYIRQDYIQNMKIDWMPGFRFTWNYNKKIEVGTMYSLEEKTKEFVRSE